MNCKSHIFPPGPRPIFPPGRSAGNRDGTSPPEEGDFHGKPEPPPHLAIPDKERDGPLQARGDPHLGGTSIGDRGGTSPPEEGDFHGKPEPPPHLAIPDKERDGQLQARGDPHPGGTSMSDRGGTSPPEEGDFHGKPEPPPHLAIPDKERDVRDRTFKLPDRKRTVDYEHRPLSPPGGGWREPAQGPPHFLNSPAPPGLMKYKFNSLSAERNPGPRLGAPPGTVGMKLAEIQTTNQGR